MTGEQFHELCLYCLVDVADTDLLSRGESFPGAERGKGQRFTWMAFEQVAQEYLYPLFIKKHIHDLPKQLTLLTENE